MIRRSVEKEFWLIAQTDHARLSGEMASQIGNATFEKPADAERVVRAIAMHDAGWPLHDDHPGRSAAGLPLDVFESPRAITYPVWLESAKRAMAVDPYVGVLVALHQLHLSSNSVSANQPARFDVQQMRQQFDLNKFQHQVIELLEAARAKVGLRVDKPLRLGLSEGWTDAAEERLKHAFRYLQAMDLLSLGVCCTEPPQSNTNPVHTRPGSPTTPLQIHRPSADVMFVKPWPFAPASFTLSVPYRPVPARAYVSDDELRVVYASAPQKSFDVTLRSA